MTFNIRFDTAIDDPAGDRWADRRASVLETVRRFDPDVIGFQEAIRSQLDDLVEAFPDHQAIGEPREAAELAEYVPLFFRRDRFDADRHGDFWLSASPEVEGSRGWDADNPRHCTWVVLRHRTADFRFAVFNTHLDRWGTVSRLEASRLIVKRVALASELPSIVMGDFNAEEASEPLEAFRAAGFRDTFRLVRPEAEDVQTIHHYNELSGSRKIDYIMCDERWEVIDAAIVRERARGRLPSDHFPLIAVLAPSSVRL